MPPYKSRDSEPILPRPFLPFLLRFRSPDGVEQFPTILGFPSHPTRPCQASHTRQSHPRAHFRAPNFLRDRIQQTDHYPTLFTPAAVSRVRTQLKRVYLVPELDADLLSGKSVHHGVRIFAAVRSRRLHSFRAVTDRDYDCQKGLAAVRHSVCSDCWRVEDI